METPPPNGQPPSPPPDDQEQERLRREQQLLEAKLLETSPPSPTPAPRSSIPSEMEALKSLVETVVIRVDQLARTMAEVFSQVHSVSDQQVATMRLEQEMIARTDELHTTLGDEIDKMQESVAAVIKVNANLSEIVAALTDPDHKA